MSPSLILNQALGLGINLISVTDHNTTTNSLTLGRLALRKNLPFFYGMEVQTEEEVHILVYFDELQSFERFGNEVYGLLPEVKNDPQFFGDQVALDEEENILYLEEKLLLNSCAISLQGLCSLAEKRGGLVIPAHVDASHFSLLSQLGMIPQDLHFKALEVSPAYLEKGLALPQVEGYPLLSFSDAHYPGEIGRATTLLLMEKPTLEEFRLALEGKRGRGILRKELRGKEKGHG